ncbi:hypothetical protein N181_10120 [Sinorhizobium fredii USDA 205]|uniref:Uncharacterized protein n=1 Tax=Sinorhizobium fredii (strain HH103) TaxID=1117943 RepID=G9A7R2_SINF1|nr:hypothetical protein SF83666_c18830 [Sinorhizobium fredii CCBAU 83666]AWI57584.1 hypothetical protein AB395_00001930 [Sinorhizobium fredii CCBAU 45436]AWM25434.1 hypothetical protein AOX55_00002182 [Sinorhizobium fredii CCBAU 25509]KSV90976.1 hypothetical protein N181_10120 [Sinorhizobium fredii USDA 205]CCE96292.1 hypothetical protein SFHH103_01795 [Sinorhizobium fredii HH103]
MQFDILRNPGATEEVAEAIISSDVHTQHGKKMQSRAGAMIST